MSPEVARRVVLLFQKVRPPESADYRLSPTEIRLLKLFVIPFENTLEGYLFLCRRQDGKRGQNQRGHRQVDIGSLHNESPFRSIDLAAGSDMALR